MLNHLKEIIERVIGEPRRDSGGWYEYNCPYCAEEKNVESDGKYNLAVNYGEDGTTRPYFHCWRCETSGKLSKLIADYGNRSMMNEFKEEIRNIRSSLMYQMNFGNGSSEDIQMETSIDLPDDFRKVTKNDKYAKEAYDYLKSRGLNEYFIKRFNIGYVPYWAKDKEMRNRIIIPSYDEYGELNYYVARDYSGKRKNRKYNNPNLKKTMFVFNEAKVNWYEDVTLVEGAFDHMVIPNSIPLLGKTLKQDYATYKAIIANAMANVNVLLDDDAVGEAERIYKLLNSTKLHDRVRIIICPQGFDASDIYQKYKRNGVLKLMRTARQLDEYEMVNNDEN